MKLPRLVVTSLALLAVAATFALVLDAGKQVKAQGASPQGVQVQKDLVYATHDGVELKGDLYAPAGPGPFPALVLFHGGGWQAGSKAGWASWGNYLARHGYVAFAAAYRLSKPNRPSFMESIWDTKAAVQYLRGRAAQLKVDPDRIGAMGASAGGHLAAMLALTGDNQKFANPYAADPHRSASARIKVAIPVYGVFDMIQQWEHDQLARPRDQITEKYLGGTPVDIRERFYEASPLYHASRQNAQGTRWLVAWGTKDDIVDSDRQSEVFVAHLKRAGATVRTVPIDGAPHFWLNDAPVDQEGSHNAYFAPRLLNFLRSYL
ncbi:MAG: alpha/beta hydrolase fold domain-containing protein [Deltaproteobacteria bacterium]|nr:alpha/beta hydrolase fold domain-containing protein [Deltaproteobacteria bacterium]